MNYIVQQAQIREKPFFKLTQTVIQKKKMDDSTKMAGCGNFVVLIIGILNLAIGRSVSKFTIKNFDSKLLI